MRRQWIAAPAALICILLAASACGGDGGSPGAAPDASGVLGTASETPTTGTATPTTGTSSAGGGGGGGGGGGTASGWPSPEECITYNPATIAVRYEAGVHMVHDGLNNIIATYGGPGENIGQKLLAVAKRYRKVCFIGRSNFREDNDEYIFEYWRDPSGISSPVPDSADDCSPYDRTNLTVEDMGSGHGWRVKDHDHVLQVFDHESDARNGKIVLAKYSQICTVPGDRGHGPADVTYS